MLNTVLGLLGLAAFHLAGAIPCSLYTYDPTSDTYTPLDPRLHHHHTCPNSNPIPAAGFSLLT